MSEDTPFPVVASQSERRAEIIASIRAETGIDEAMIDRLLRGFYARVREDDLIGPIFVALSSDWEPHLQRMCAFWSSVILMTGYYHGQPMQCEASRTRLSNNSGHCGDLSERRSVGRNCLSLCGPF